MASCGTQNKTRVYSLGKGRQRTGHINLKGQEGSHQLHLVQLGLEVRGGQVVPGEKQIHQRMGRKMRETVMDAHELWRVVQGRAHGQRRRSGSQARNQGASGS